MIVDKIALGEFEIQGLRDGFFRLDGGAMFGVVPKPLWEKKFPSDDQNRIKLALNSFLIRKSGLLILVETGIGSDLDQKIFKYYSVEREPGLVGDLQRLGHQAEDINFVINTHLHFDHCGGSTHKKFRSLRREYTQERRGRIRANLSSSKIHHSEGRMGIRAPSQ
jgi:glyoxylase-like metal-dependent hydrolase (beta-lactamase superfamily II)